jgi:TetR/AcrR family transcriptional regulator, mexJK operon transcriptional repressor
MIPDAQRRDIIIGAAWRAFVGIGYNRTTMNGVAAAASVSLTTVYRLFPSKVAMFEAVVECHRQTMIALPGDYDTVPIAEALARIFRIDIDPEADNERQALMNFLITEGRTSPELWRIVEAAGPETARRLLAGWLERQERLGRLRAGNIEVSAHMLMDIAFGALADKRGIDHGWPGGTNRAVYLRSCFALLTDGLAPR